MKMKKLLIIRSVSFQQLDTNIVKIIEKFCDYEIHILTHEHGRVLAEKYRGIEKIWIYPYKSAFSFKSTCVDITGMTFDAVVIPVTNIGASGFQNVFMFALTIKSIKYYVCNLVSEIDEISKTRIIIHSFLKAIVMLFSCLLSILFVVVALPWLMIRLSKKTP